MISEININSKDFVRLNVLEEILNKEITLGFQLNNNQKDDYADSIHSETSRVRVYGRFNISEDKANNMLTLRPVMIGERLKLTVSSNKNFSGKEILIVRSGVKMPEKDFPITKALTALEFIPQGKEKYLLKIHYDDLVNCINETIVKEDKAVNQEDGFVVVEQSVSRDNQDFQFEPFEFDSRFELDTSDAITGGTDSFDLFGYDNQVESNDTRNETKALSEKDVKEEERPISNSDIAERQEKIELREGVPEDIRRVEQEIEIVERKHIELKQRHNSAINHLEKIEAEYRKDYDALNEELEDVKSRLEADASIIEYYKDRDILSVETLLQEAKLKLEDAESQIKMFIQAKQQKTMEIESEVKANKK